MNTTPTGSPVSSFQSLATVAAQLAINGRSVRSAAVKQAMRRSDPAFDEKAAGYSSFRDFLRAAEMAGYVQLLQASTGPDVEVRVTGTTTAVGSNVANQRVREDLWRAFTDWTLGLLRFWHPEAQRAYAVTAAPADGEPPEHASARLAFMSRPTDFVPIDHIPRETVYGWMSEFAQSTSSGKNEQLASALQAQTPFRAFTDQARELGLSGYWHAEHTRRVADHIRTWAQAHNVVVDPFEVSLKKPTRPLAPPESIDVKRLRAAAHQIVDRMTVDELLNIRVRLGDALDL